VRGHSKTACHYLDPFTVGFFEHEFVHGLLLWFLFCYLWDLVVSCHPWAWPLWPRNLQWLILVGTHMLACYFFLVATFLAAPRRSGLGSCLRLRAAADARPFLPKACAFDCGKHLGLPSLELPRAHGPMILP
jgi:hypothetical protein